MSEQIRAYVDRIIRLKEEARDINRDVREIYAEAKATGHDKTILGKLVNYIEKRNDDSNAVAESEALFELYLSAYDGVGTVRATHTHEAISSPVNDSGQGEADGAFQPGNHTSVPSAPISTPAKESQLGHGGQRVGRADDEQRDAPRVPRPVGRREGVDEVDQGQGAGASEPDRDMRAVAGVVDSPDEDRGSRHVGGEARHEVTEPVSAPSTADADDRDAPLASSSTAGVSVVTNVTVPRPEGCQSPNACGSSSWRRLCHSCQRAWDAEHGHTSGDAA